MRRPRYPFVLGLSIDVLLIDFSLLRTEVEGLDSGRLEGLRTSESSEAVN